jgi:hypothetical protein
MATAAAHNTTTKSRPLEGKRGSHRRTNKSEKMVVAASGQVHQTCLSGSPSQEQRLGSAYWHIGRMHSRRYRVRTKVLLPLAATRQIPKISTRHGQPGLTRCAMIMAMTGTRSTRQPMKAFPRAIRPVISATRQKHISCQLRDYRR